MTMREENFGIAAFRSRQQVLALTSALHRAGIRASVVTTPRDVALGCGLSVRFELGDAAAVRDVYQQAHPGNLIGFYRVAQGADGRTAVSPLPLDHTPRW